MNCRLHWRHLGIAGGEKEARAIKIATRGDIYIRCGGNSNANDRLMTNEINEIWILCLSLGVTVFIIV